MPEPEAGIPVGIDLGTTFSAVAYVDRSGRATTIPNSDGTLTTPSVVFFEPPTVLVGRQAAKAALIEPENGADCFKRDMGRPYYCRKVQGKQMRPEGLSAIILKKLKQDAEDKMGEITDAVITVPAYFDDKQRKATQDAAEIAGFEVLSIINEPSAAAIAYGYDKSKPGDPGGKVMVYDLGGGTFDVTLMQAHSNYQFETIATDGDGRLGGKDWDERVIAYVAGEFMREAGVDPREDAVSYQELVLRCEEAKCSLSSRTGVKVYCSHAGHRVAVELTRQKLEELTLDLLQRTQTTLTRVMEQAELSWDAVERVLLVGGSTRMPSVRSMIKRVTGKEPNCVLSPDEAVAHGAAIFAASLCARVDTTGTAYEPDANKTLRIIEQSAVNAHSLGVWAKNKSGQDINSIVIPKNTPIPCSKTRTYAAPGGGRVIRIRVLEGESPDPNACTMVREWRLSELPRDLPPKTPLEITFSYSADGRIFVTTVVKTTGARATMQIIDHEGMEKDEIEDATDQLDELEVV